jgi:hypothetical protein
VCAVLLATAIDHLAKWPALLAKWSRHSTHYKSGGRCFKSWPLATGARAGGGGACAGARHFANLPARVAQVSRPRPGRSRLRRRRGRLCPQLSPRAGAMPPGLRAASGHRFCLPSRALVGGPRIAGTTGLRRGRRYGEKRHRWGNRLNSVVVRPQWGWYSFCVPSRTHPLLSSPLIRNALMGANTLDE